MRISPSVPKQINYPFTIITGEGLGISYSSFKQVDSPIPWEPLGQAKVKAYVNLANGNLFVEDHALTLAEVNCPITFNYIYNSQTGNPATAWKLAVGKRLKLPPSGNNLTLIEPDGHETIYSKDDPKINVYRPPGLGNGLPILKYDDVNKYWEIYYPDTHITEIYDSRGLQQSHRDLSGRTTTYKYDDKQQLSDIITPSSHYEIKRTPGVVTINLLKDAKPIPLRTYRFDDLGCLQQSETPDGYIIKYNYYPKSNYLMSIDQSDKTHMDFMFEGPVLTQKLSSIQVGNSTPGTTGLTGKINFSRYYFNYKSNSGTMRTTAIPPIELTFDGKARLKKVSQEGGYSPQTKTKIETNYDYNTKGQLSQIIRPGCTPEIFEYNNFYGCLTRHVEPNGQETKRYYYIINNHALICAIAKTKEDAKEHKSTQLVTRFVYDNFYDKFHPGSSILRFIISPSGQVTSQEPDSMGNPGSIRVFLKTNIPLHPYKPDSVMDLKYVLDWINHLPKDVKTCSSLINQIFNTRGQITTKSAFAHLDSEGKGIIDAQMSLQNREWNPFGICLKNEIKIDEKRSALTLQFSDDLQRIKELIDPIGYKTIFEHQDSKSQIQITHPNGRIDTKQFDGQGMTTSDIEEVKTDTGIQARATTHELNVACEPIVTQHPDGRRTIQFYNKERELSFYIRPCAIAKDQKNFQGIVTEYLYDTNHRYTATIRYANLIATESFCHPGLLPEFSFFREELEKIKDDSKDRYTYRFNNESGTIHYEVDEDRYLTEYLYDRLDRHIGTITYQQKISLDDLAKLKNGLTLTLTPDPEKDHCNFIFYDDNDQIIAELDPAGYVTEYKRDAGGRITEKIVYDNPVTKDLYSKIPPSYEELKAQIHQLNSTGLDEASHTYYYRDARGQCEIEVDAENFMTVNTYLANGLIASKKRFYNKVDDAAWLKDKNIHPNPPTSSVKDQMTDYNYDLMGREIEVNYPANRTELSKYDEMSHPIFQQIKDRLSSTFTADDQRAPLNVKYDAWEQIAAEANLFVSQLLTEVESNPDLDHEQKAAAKKIIWEHSSTRHIRDGSGLLLKTINSLGGETIFYYDEDRRPIITINPNGSVIEVTLNTFGEPDQTRTYSTLLAKDILLQLSGGFITAEIRNIFDNLKSDKDPIEKVAQRNLRGQVEKSIDAEGNEKEQEYDAWQNNTIERLPVNDKKPSLKIEHKFDTRNHESERISSADGKTITEKWEHKHPFGVETLHTSPTNAKTATFYDRLANPNKIVDPLGYFITKIWDAFNRIETEIDESGKSTKYDYDDKTATHTIFSPIQGIFQKIISNVFGQARFTTNSLGHTHEFYHAPDGQESMYVNPLKYISEKVFNLLGWKTEFSDLDKTVTLWRHNEIGNVIKEIIDVDRLALSTDFIIGALNCIREIIDPMNVRRTQGFDKRQRLIQKITDPDGLGLLELIRYNALQYGKISLQQGDLKNPDQYLKKLLFNGFAQPTGEVVDPKTTERPIALELKRTQTLDDDGKPIQEIDANGNPTYTAYDKKRQKRFLIGADGAVSEWEYTPTGKIKLHRDYALRIDPTRISKLKDLEEVIAEVKKSTADKVIWHFYDDCQRECFSVSCLGAVTEKRYDAASRNIETICYATRIEPSQIPSFSYESLAALIKTKESIADRHTYKIYDAANQERFVITPAGTPDPDQPVLGAITKKIYDPKGREIYTINYGTFVVKPDELANFSESKMERFIDENVQNPLQDNTTIRIFDSAGRPEFTIESVTDTDIRYRVTKFQHDKNGNLLSECKFSSPIPPQQNYAAYITYARNLTPDPKKDRITRYEYDKANRRTKVIDALQNADKYKLDALSSVVEHIDRNQASRKFDHDRAKRCISETFPTTTLTQVQPDPEQKGLLGFKQFKASSKKIIGFDKLENKTLIEFISELALDPLNATPIRVVDTQGRPQFILKPAMELGTKYEIIRYDYDEKKPDVQECAFAESITLPKDHTELVKVIRELKPNPIKDKITAFSSATKIRSSQMIEVQLEQKNGKLQLLVPTETRTFLTDYTPYNLPSKTAQPEIPINDIDRKATTSFTTDRPEKTLTLTTETIYNVKKLPIVEKNSDGKWSFKIYDAEFNLIYEISSEKEVKGYSYNAFGEVICETQYSTRLTLDLSTYTNTGIPLDILESKLIKDPKNDRHKTITRDRRGNDVLVEQDEIYCYFPDAKSPQMKKIKPTTIKRFNALNHCIYSAKMDYNKSTQSITWKSDIFWVNCRGKILASCNALNYFTRFKHNVFDEEVQQTQFAKALPIIPKTNSKLADVDKTVIPSAEDRVTMTAHNLLGLKEFFVIYNVTLQDIIFENKIPKLINNPQKKNIIFHYQYNRTEKDIIVSEYTLNVDLDPFTTKPEGALIRCKYRNERDDIIAEAGEARKQLDTKGEPASTLIPLTHYGVNSHGQQVLAINFEMGTDKADLSEVPKPLKPSPGDQYTLSWLDKRGKTLVSQDPKKSQKGTTYTPLGNKARLWNLLSYWKLKDDKFSTDQYVDEKRFNYDSIEDKPIKVEILRDGLRFVSMLYQLNAFREIDAEGIGDLENPKWRLFRSYNQIGFVWKTNEEDGEWIILMPGLNGQKAAIFRSPTKILNIPDYDQLPQLMDWTHESLERTEFVFNPIDQIESRLLPAYEDKDSSLGDYLPLSIFVSYESYLFPNKLSLTWLQPQDQAINKIELTLWPANNSSHKISLPVKTLSGRQGVDISTLPTDRYEYLITYYLHFKKDDKPSFHTTGVVQFVNVHDEKSQWLVTEVKFENQLYLRGLTKNISQVILKQGSERIDTVPVQKDEKSSQLFVDLKAYQSGNYTVQPISSDKAELPDSLPFTVYTSTRASIPLAREISVQDVKILTLEQDGHHGQIKWTVIDPFKTRSVRMICNYIDDQDQPKQYIDIIPPGRVIKRYQDSQGNILDCNTEFPTAVAKIVSLSLSLELNNDERVWLMEEATPIASKKMSALRKSIPKMENKSILIGEMNSSFEDDDDDSGWDFIGIPLTTSLQALHSSTMQIPTPEQTQEVKETQPSSKTVEDNPPELIDDYFTLIELPDNIIQTTSFGSRNIQYIAPIAKLIQRPTLIYLDTSEDQFAGWKPLTCIGINAKEGLSIDVTTIPIGYYQFRIGDDKTNYDFIIAHGGRVYFSQDTRPNVLLRPCFKDQHDRWDNVIGATDPRGYTTETTFNHGNQPLTITEPVVDAVQPNGSVIEVKPVTRFGYQSRGALIGVCDPNGHTTATQVDEVGQPVKTILPDGLVSQTNIIDAMQRIKVRIDMRGEPWYYDYGLTNKVIMMTSPEKRVTRFELNESDLLMMETDPSKNQRRYNFNPIGDVIESFLPDKKRTTRTLNHNHQVLNLNYWDGTHIVINRDDFFGVEFARTDLSGALITLKRDQKKQVVRQYSTGGNHGDHARLTFDGSKYHLQIDRTPDQNLEFKHKVGRLTEVQDHARGTIDHYKHDIEGNILSRLTQNILGAIIRKADTELDALRRMLFTRDRDMSVHMAYQANSCVAGIRAAIYQSGVVSLSQSRDYKTDPANRVISDICRSSSLSWVNGQLTISEIDSLLLEYKYGIRHKEARTTQGKTVVTTLGYDKDSLLKSTTSDSLNTSRGYDLSGILNFYNEIKMGPLEITSDDISVNENGWQTNVTHTDKDKKKTETDYKHFLNPGLPRLQTIRFPKGRNHMVQQYIGFSSQLLSKISGTYIPDDGDPVSLTPAMLLYDANGSLNWQSGDDGNGNEQYIKLTCTWDGIPLEKSAFKKDHGAFKMLAKNRFYFTPGGQYLASLNDISDSKNATPQISLGYTVASRHGHLVSPHTKKSDSKLEISDYIPPISDKTLNFGFSRVEAQPGDTFRTLARRNYDESYALAIAAVNGSFSADDKPIEGTTITIPPQIPIEFRAHNSVSVQKLMNTIVKNVYPHLELHPHQNLFSIFVMSMALAISIALAPHLAPFLIGPHAFGLLGITMQHVLTGVCAGIIEAGQQEIMKGVHLIQNVSWEQVIEASISAGLPSPGEEGLMLSQRLKRISILAVTDQLKTMAIKATTKDKVEFNMHEVFTNITAQVANLALQNHGILAPIDTTISGAIIQSAITNQPFHIDQFAAQAMGSFLGTQVGNALGSQIDKAYARHELHVYKDAIRALPRSSNGSLSQSDQGSLLSSQGSTYSSTSGSSSYSQSSDDTQPLTSSHSKYAATVRPTTTANSHHATLPAATPIKTPPSQKSTHLDIDLDFHDSDILLSLKNPTTHSDSTHLPHLPDITINPKQMQDFFDQSLWVGGLASSVRPLSSPKMSGNSFSFFKRTSQFIRNAAKSAHQNILSPLGNRIEENSQAFLSSITSSGGEKQIFDMMLGSPDLKNLLIDFKQDFKDIYLGNPTIRLQAGINLGIFALSTVATKGRTTRSIGDIELNAFHTGALNLSEEGQQNIRILRNWAKSRGWVKFPEYKGYTEEWGIYNKKNQFEWRLAIKTQPGISPGLEMGSKLPRFDARIQKISIGNQDRSLYINPFTNEIGIGRNIGTHINLETLEPMFQQKSEMTFSP